LLFVWPALWKALAFYVKINRTSVPAELATAAQMAEALTTYYEFPWSSVGLAGQPWLLTLAVLAAVVGLACFNQVTMLSLAWVGLLYLLGSTYVLGIPLLNLTNLGAVLIMLYLPIALLIGAATGALAERLATPWRTRFNQVVVSVALVAGLLMAPVRVRDIEAFRYFVTPPDLAAMAWINANTPEDALFAVNTHFWVPTMAHGTDGGYWIPYFTGRQITAGVMLLGLADYAYQSKILTLSRSVQRLASEPNAVDELRVLGVDYIYIGAGGNFDGSGFVVQPLEQAGQVEVVYQDGAVFILRIKQEPK